MGNKEGIEKEEVKTEGNKKEEEEEKKEDSKKPKKTTQKGSKEATEKLVQELQSVKEKGEKEGISAEPVERNLFKW